MSCGTSLAAPGLFPGLFHTQSFCIFFYLSPQCLSQRSPIGVLGTPADTSSTGQDRNTLIRTHDKPSLLIQMVSTPFIALSISWDLDLKAFLSCLYRNEGSRKPQKDQEKPVCQSGYQSISLFYPLTNSSVRTNTGSIRTLTRKKSHLTFFPQKIVTKHCLFLEHSECCWRVQSETQPG